MAERAYDRHDLLLLVVTAGIGRTRSLVVLAGLSLIALDSTELLVYLAPFLIRCENISLHIFHL